jgi:hypothetical protein
MNDNLTVVNKYSITDLSITKVSEKPNIFNDNAIKNIAEDIKVVNERNKNEGTVLADPYLSYSEFVIPKLSQITVSNKNYFRNAQRWIGHVISIDGETFSAKLEDLKSLSTYEIAEFENKEVPEDDIELIGIGNVFYWSVGYNVKNGTVQKVSILKFQRLPILDADEIEEKVKSLDSAVDHVDNLLEKIICD